jgi:hypothetical protein
MPDARATLINPDITVRPMRADEQALWEPLWNGYLEFYVLRNRAAYSNSDRDRQPDCLQ